MMSGRLPSHPSPIRRRADLGGSTIHSHRPRRHRSLALVYRRPAAGAPMRSIAAGNGAPVRLSLHFSWQVWLAERLTTVVRQATVPPSSRGLPSTRPVVRPDGGPARLSRVTSLVGRVLPGRAGGPRPERPAYQVPDALSGKPGGGQVPDSRVRSAEGLPGGHGDHSRPGPMALRTVRHPVLPAQQEASTPASFLGAVGVWSGIRRVEQARAGHGLGADRGGDAGGTRLPGRRRSGPSTQEEARGTPLGSTRKFRARPWDLAEPPDSMRPGTRHAAPPHGGPAPASGLPRAPRVLPGSPADRPVPGPRAQSAEGMPEGRGERSRPNVSRTDRHRLPPTLRETGTTASFRGARRASWSGARRVDDWPGAGRHAGTHPGGDAGVAGRRGRPRVLSVPEEAGSERSDVARKYRTWASEVPGPSNSAQAGTADTARPHGVPGPATGLPPAARDLRPAARVHREQPPSAVVQAPAVQASSASVRPTAPPIDIDRLDNELWQRFEKRVRIENERRGRG
jgi:hypothetical protein